MALKQTDLASGKRQAPQAFTSGLVVTYLTTFTFKAGETVGSDDIIELGPLPVGCRLISVKQLGESDPALTFGLLTGVAGVRDDERSIETEITESNAHEIGSFDVARGIGAQVAEDVAGTGQQVVVEVLFTQH